MRIDERNVIHCITNLDFDSNLVAFLYCVIPRTAEPGGVAGPVAPHFFSNVMLKQLRFKTLVVKFPREAHKMLYFYLKPPPHS